MVADGKRSETSLMNQMEDGRAIAFQREQQVLLRDDASFQQPKKLKVRRV